MSSDDRRDPASAADTDNATDDRRLAPPEACILWREPERAAANIGRDCFDLVEVVFEDSHSWRNILRCRECGQLYLYDFFEMVDWEDGEDPQYWMWIPVGSPEEAAEIKGLPTEALSDVYPRLQRDYPKGATAPKLYWVGRRNVLAAAATTGDEE